MNKTLLLDRFSRDGEERIVLARVLDQLERAQSRSIPCATHFLSPAQRAAVQPLLDACGHPPHLFFGGWEGAERTVCVFLPHWMDGEDWLLGDRDPLSAVECLFPRGSALSHRDILGGLMGIGLTREKVGDILLLEDRAQIIALKEAVPIILSQFDQAGRCRLHPAEIPLSALSPAPAQVKTIRDTVSALRLDAVLAAGFSLSRSRAAELIAGGKVSVNHRECVKADRAVAQGDTVTCRGLGKFVLTGTGGLSKKGRTIIEIERYI